MIVYDMLERYVGHRERKLGSVVLVFIAGLSILSFTADIFTWLDKGIESLPLLTLRNGFAVLLILIAIGWWKNRLG